MKKTRILIVDDDAVACEFLKETLCTEGYAIETLTSAKAVLSKDLSQYHLLISDIRMPEVDGISLLKSVKGNYPNLPVILMTAFGSLETTMSAFRSGAWDYISKPFSPPAIRSLVKKVMEVRTISKIQKKTNEEVATQAHFIGSSVRMVDFYKQLARIANSHASVLIEGESGTGKELASRSLHQMSDRADKPFITVHCGAIPETLLESELFGYEKGAFTGADKTHKGLLEAAQNGTIFFDEITEMSVALQGKLLRFMQNGEIRHVGGNETKTVSVRVVAAGNKNIDNAVKTGNFRDDLLYRFVVRLKIPSLRERKEDIPLLVECFLKKLSYSHVRISDDTMQILMGYEWPGNVRELENVLQHILLMTPYPVILPENLPERFHHQQINISVAQINASTFSPLEEAQMASIISVLNKNHWNQSLAATELGIDRKTLRTKIRRYDLIKND
ncbi:MAG: sigma-54 dependent transcriptional regulator [Deltaproteobacteria bacterium]